MSTMRQAPQIDPEVQEQLRAFYAREDKIRERREIAIIVLCWIVFAGAVFALCWSSLRTS
jgi:uncharacterized membrane protein (GlpM family)